MHSRYDLRPVVEMSGTDDAGQGYRELAERVFNAAGGASGGKVVAIDCYPGVRTEEIVQGLSEALPELVVCRTETARLPRRTLDSMLARFLTDDRVFGFMAPFRLAEFFSQGRLDSLDAEVRAARNAGRTVLVIGVGAFLASGIDRRIYADMPRWELQARMRAGASSWTADDGDEDMLRRYKRGYFVEWRVADRHKMAHFDDVDFFLDTTRTEDPRFVAGSAMRSALAELTTRPFRLVPFFDPGVWGGQWMRRQFGLADEPKNFAWGFDCVPEENSLLLRFAGLEVEIPAINLVLRHPEALLGPRVHARFGAEFPIRFDFLDTVEGGNLSLQVHPRTSYIQQNFGVPYTQDESYYILDAEPDASVYLGVRDGADVHAFVDAVAAAQAGDGDLDVERYVNRWPSKKHDHFSIPAGTVHCSGSGCVVLEISATPYIFTFKLWDWGRLGLDGKPRPVHLEHGRHNIDGKRDATWVRNTVLPLCEKVAEGDGWVEERTGLHELEFIETRRHWFENAVSHHTSHSVNVLNLVEGDEAIVESPDGAFSPFPVHYAETFVVPAAVGPYRIRPGRSGARHATMKAMVRT